MKNYEEGNRLNIGFNIINTNFVFKTSDGCYFHFAYDAKSVLKFRKLQPGLGWSKWLNLIEEVTLGIAMDMDANDMVHIVFQNLSGSIIYATFDGLNLQAYEMLKSRTNEVYQHYFKIIPGKKHIHFLYLVKKEQHFSLVHNYLNHAEFSVPKILGTLHSDAYFYAANSSYNGDIFLAYSGMEDRNLINYRRFQLDRMLWNEERKVKCEEPERVCIHSCGLMQNVQASMVLLSKNRILSRSIDRQFNVTNESVLYEKVAGVQSLEMIPYIPAKKSFLIFHTTKEYTYINLMENHHLKWENIRISHAEAKICQYRSNYGLENVAFHKMPVVFHEKIQFPVLAKIDCELSYKSILFRKAEQFWGD